MKFAVYTMIFDSQKWFDAYLQNVYPHIDRIYLSYSKLPWGYKSSAREKYVNTFDLDLVKKSKYSDKITLLIGDWMTDAQQRTSCLQFAKKDNVDFLIAQDFDEFFFHDDYEKMKWAVINNPDYDAYLINQYSFWKSFKYVLCSPNSGRITGQGQKIINVHTTEKYYEEELSTNPSKIASIDDIAYYHGSYVLTDEEVYKKINAWTHTNDFDTEKWYNEVWLPWTLESKNLHPIWPEVWSHCEEFNDPLPEEIKNLNL